MCNAVCIDRVNVYDSGSGVEIVLNKCSLFDHELDLLTFCK